jgi:hypothetical protein
MDVMGGCWVVVAILAAGTIGCVGLLGLDHGIPEDPDASADADVPDGPAPEEASSDHASATDGPTSLEDASREGAGELDVAVAPDVATAPDVADDHTTDAPLAGDAADAAPTCRPALQPCQAGSDCCSGVCGAGLTCL